MSNFQHQHVEAIGFAGMEVQELENLVQAAKERQGQVLGAILNAVGDSPSNEHARQAYEWIAGLGDGLDEMIGVCENTKAQLNAYGAGI